MQQFKFNKCGIFAEYFGLVTIPHLVCDNGRKLNTYMTYGEVQLVGQMGHFYPDNCTQPYFISVPFINSCSGLTAINFTFFVSLSSDSATLALAVVAGSLSTDCREVAG